MKVLLRLQLLLSIGVFAGAACITIIHILSNRRITAYEPDYCMVMLHAFSLGIWLGISVIAVSRAEQTSRWSQYIKALPVSARMHTDAKYLFSLLNVPAAAILGGTEAALSRYMTPRHTGGISFAPVPAAAALAAAWTLLVSGFLLYAVLRRSRRRGIVLYLPVIVTGIAVFFPLTGLFLRFSGALMKYCFYEDAPVSRISLLYPYWTLAIAAVLFLLSWQTARRRHCRSRKKVPA